MADRLTPERLVEGATGEWAPVAGEDDWRNRRETDHLIRSDGYHWPLNEPHGAADGSERLVR